MVWVLQKTSLLVSDVVEDSCGDYELCQVLVHLEACAESLPACPEATKGAFHCHAAPAQGVVAFLSVGQLPPLGFISQGRRGVGHVLDEEGEDNDIADDKISEPVSVESALYQPRDQGVSEDMGIVGVSF